MFGAIAVGVISDTSLLFWVAFCVCCREENLNFKWLQPFSTSRLPKTPKIHVLLQLDG